MGVSLRQGVGQSHQETHQGSRGALRALVGLVYRANGGVLLAPLVRFVWPLVMAMVCVSFVVLPDHNRHIYGIGEEGVAELCFGISALAHLAAAFMHRRLGFTFFAFLAGSFSFIGRAVDIWAWNSSQVRSVFLAGLLYIALAFASLIVLLVQVGLELARRINGRSRD